MTAPKNLTEQLFKPQFCYPETSSLIHIVGKNNVSFDSLLDGKACGNWYRVLNKLVWYWQGLSLIEIDEVLARIAVSDKKKSNEKWLDTVIGYQSGNWVYEFLLQSVKWQKQAEQMDPNTQSRKQLFDTWLMSGFFADLASYPYYRNDDLASKAQVFAFRAYREAMNYSPYQIKELEFIVDGKNIKAMLHTPLTHDETPHTFPVVFLCAGLCNLQMDFYRYFADYLAPQGIGLLTVDTPSIGYSKQINLTQNTSIIHQSILEQIKSVPLIDYSNVILLGYRFGANIATRLAYLMPKKIKGVINIGPLVHQLFVDSELQNTLPVMYKDMIAQRLGLNNISDQQLMAELTCFSLKKQGLLLRPCHVPLLNISFEGDLISSDDEAKLLQSTQKTISMKIKKSHFKESLPSSLAQSLKWIKALIK